MTEQRIFTFRLLLSGPIDDDTAATLMGACGDMLLSTQGHRLSADFDRSADSLEDAVLSAIRDLENAGAAVTAERVEPDDLVTSTVIAERTGRTRQSISQLIAGDRGPGGFPEPLAFVDAKTRLWRWSEVMDWIEEAGIADVHSEPSSARERRFLAAMNGALETRLNLRAYRDGGGDEQAAAAISDIATGNSSSAVEADSSRVATLRTGMELLDLARGVLDDQKARAAWMEASLAGFSRAFRIYLAGHDADAWPFEELVVEGMTCAALTKISHHASTGCLFDEIECVSGRWWTESKSQWHRHSRGNRLQVHPGHSHGMDLHTVLVDGLQASEQVAEKIVVWITHTDQDHADDLTALFGRTPAAADLETLNWDDLFSKLLAQRGSSERARVDLEPRLYGWPDSIRRAGGPVLGPPQRLWATTWSFGQTLRLYVEQTCPSQVGAVNSALAALEREG